MLEQFLDRIINEGKEAATSDYNKPEDAQRLRGALDGFELCRSMTPVDLRNLYVAVNQDAIQAVTNTDEYWYWRSRAAEVEWVCNVYSAVLTATGYEPICPHLPTMRGYIRAMQILEQLGETLQKGETMN